jgi:predicted amidophosphoribosyltransferase
MLLEKARQESMRRSKDDRTRRSETTLKGVIDNNFQKNKNDYGRLKKIENLFYLPKKNRDKFSGRIYLIDDVYTTGSTLNYGAKLLKQAGFTEVHIISFFRAVMNYY